MRVLLGSLLIRAGMAILPKEVRRLVCNVLLYHVPGGISEAEKAEVRRAIHG